MYIEDLKDFTGKVICGVFINPDKTAMRIEFSDGSAVHLECYADCCSETWIEHVTGARDIIGASIVAVEEKELGSGIPTRQECDEVYSTTIKTGGNYGEWMAIEYRNSSNGYYGGSIDASVAPAERPSDMRPITEDF